MTINRRGALGAMLGGAVAAPSVADQIASAASRMGATGVAPGGMAAKAVAEKAMSLLDDGPSQEQVERWTRLATGQALDDDLEWLTDPTNWRQIDRKLPLDDATHLASLRSVSPAAQRVLCHQRALKRAREYTVKNAIEQLRAFKLL